MKRRNIIFVDENPDVLEALRTTFEEMRDGWAMAFAQGGEEALNMLENVSFDVVIADLKVTSAAGASSSMR